MEQIEINVEANAEQLEPLVSKLHELEAALARIQKIGLELEGLSPNIKISVTTK